jgi:hypothetical protein
MNNIISQRQTNSACTHTRRHGKETTVIMFFGHFSFSLAFVAQHARISAAAAANNGGHLSACMYAEYTCALENAPAEPGYRVKVHEIIIIIIFLL